MPDRAPPPTNPVLQNLLNQPCRMCGGLERTYFPAVGLEHNQGARSWTFEAVICRRCMCIDWFIPPEELQHHESRRPHTIFHAGQQTPHR